MRDCTRCRQYAPCLQQVLKLKPLLCEDMPRKRLKLNRPGITALRTWLQAHQNEPFTILDVLEDLSDQTQRQVKDKLLDMYATGEIESPGFEQHHGRKFRVYVATLSTE